MRRPTIAVAALAILILSGCGIQPGPATVAAEAPTGMADGATLYFYDDAGVLQPQLRETGRLGTIAEALALLLTGPGESGVHTELPDNASTRVIVTPEDGAIRLTLPLSFDEVSPRGIDQLVCTAIGVHLQSGGSPDTTVRLGFTLAPPGADEDRSCPQID